MLHPPIFEKLGRLTMATDGIPHAKKKFAREVNEVTPHTRDAKSIICTLVIASACIRDHIAR